MKSICLLLVCVLAVALSGIGQPGALAQSGVKPTSPDPWPKSAQLNGAKYTLYQPQLASWDGYNLEAHAAVSVLPPGAKSPAFGAVNISAVTVVDREARVVHFQNIQIPTVNFPSAPDKGAQYQTNIQSIISRGPAAMPLDRLEADLNVLKAETKARSIPVMNPAPNFIFSQTAALLVSLDGQPVWSALPNSSLVRAINTRALLLRDKSGKLYVHLFDGYMEAYTLGGPWTVSKHPPKDADKVAQQLAKESLVDLMSPSPNPKTPNQKPPSLKTGAPTVYAQTVPTELVLTEGPPNWEQINGTNLLYVSNSTGNIAKDLDDQQTYVLVTGRWFRAPDLRDRGSTSQEPACRRTLRRSLTTARKRT